MLGIVAQARKPREPEGMENSFVLCEYISVIGLIKKLIDQKLDR